MWPEPGESVDAEAKAEVEWLIGLISSVRSTRTELNVPPSAKINWTIVELEPSKRKWLDRSTPALSRLAKSGNIIDTDVTPDFGDGPGLSDPMAERVATRHVRRGQAQVVHDGIIVLLDLEGVIDIAAEKTRLTKALEASTKEARSLEGRLSNPAFVEKAKPEAVEKARADHALHAAEAERLAAALARLG
jgi:valyl-tRNA synthetase